MAFVYWAHLPEHTDMLSQGYIGFTSGTVEKRWAGHLSDAKRCPHIIFYKALAKYGDKIVLETILEGDIDYCLDVENKLRPTNKIGWNIKVGGDYGSIGVIPSDESRKKMSESHTGEKNHFYGKTHTDEMKAKMSTDRIGTFVSQETRDKQSKARLGKKMNLSQEQRDAWSLRARSYVTSEETKKKQSEFAKGRYVAWRGAHATDVWKIAIAVYQYTLENPTFGAGKVGSIFSYTQNQMKTLFKKLKSGWIPTEDEDYQSWLAQIKENDNVS